MKTLKIKFLKDFRSPLSKHEHMAGSTLDIAVDAENFPIHSFWQSQFIDNPLSDTFVIVPENVSPEDVTTDKKPKKEK